MMPPRVRYTREFLALRLATFADRLGRSPTARDVRHAPRELVPAAETYVLRFGSWCAAQMAAGVPVIDRSERLRQTHCERGHRLNTRNTYLTHPPSHPKGLRQCRACKRRRAREYGKRYWERNRDRFNAARRERRRLARAA